MAPLREQALIEALIRESRVVSVDVDRVATLLESVLVYLVFVLKHVLQLRQFHSLDVL